MVDGKGFGPSPSRLSAHLPEISRRQTALECLLEPFRVPIRPHFGAPPPGYLRRWLSPCQDEARGTRAPPTAFDRSLPGTRLPMMVVCGIRLYLAQIGDLALKVANPLEARIK